MAPNNKKITLYMIIGLLVIFLPMSLLGIVFKVTSGSKKSNPTVTTTTANCKITLGGGSCYQCVNSGYCGLAYNYISDSNYDLNYYKDGDNTLVNSSSNVRFIVDTSNGSGISYDKDSNKVVAYYGSVKLSFDLKGVNNYSVGIDGDYYIAIDSNGLYGILKDDGSTLSYTLEPKYKYIGVHNSFTSNYLLDGSKFVAYDGNLWYIIDASGKSLNTPSLYPIYDYNDDLIVTKIEGSDYYILYNYSGSSYFPYSFLNVYVLNSYVGLETTNHEFYVIDSSNKATVSTVYDTLDYDDIILTSDDNGNPVVMGDGNILETLS